MVIPVGPNDVPILEQTLSYNKKNIIGYRNIYILTNPEWIQDTSFLSEPTITIIDERNLPITIQTITEHLGETKRVGWYLQQLLKLYAGFFIPDILEYYLVVDADTAFLKPIPFFDGDLPLYNYGFEYHLPYFEHMKRLHPALGRASQFSGICHHMMFYKPLVRVLMFEIEKHHNQSFVEVFLSSVDKKEIEKSGASEYEIYFHFLLAFHRNKMRIRPLCWMNATKMEDKDGIEVLDYISCHYHLQGATPIVDISSLIFNKPQSTTPHTRMKLFR